MNPWLLAAGALLLAFVPCLWALARARAIEQLAIMQMASVLCPLVLLLLAQGFNQPTFGDLAIAFSLLSFPAALLFAHFFERWL